MNKIKAILELTGFVSVLLLVGVVLTIIIVSTTENILVRVLELILIWSIILRFAITVIEKSR